MNISRTKGVLERKCQLWFLFQQVNLETSTLAKTIYTTTIYSKKKKI